MADRTNSTDWDTEDAYWRTSYKTRPYAGSNDYSYYQPGYRYGYESANRYQGREWSDVEPDLQRTYKRLHEMQFDPLGGERSFELALNRLAAPLPRSNADSE